MNKIFKALLMILPAILVISLVLLLTHTLFSDFTSNNVFASVLISKESATSNTSKVKEEEKNEFKLDLPNTVEYSDDTINVIDFGSQWAIINVENWNNRDIPVYFGDTYEILTKGAGSWIGASFCGQGKTCIVSANAMTHFYEIEDTSLGDIVTVNTVYGAYEYEVCDKFIFDKNDIAMLYEENDEDTLILHTTYPRSFGAHDASERIALICTLKRGTIYKSTFDK